jgi:AP-2 complex subunit sigma-1
MSKIIYRRYAGLFFCACVDTNDNELAYLEAIHFFVEVLDAFFGNVCELDLVFNFYKVGVTPIKYARMGPCRDGLWG